MHHHNRLAYGLSLLILLLGVTPTQAGKYRNSGSLGLDGDNYHFGFISTTAGYTMLSVGDPNIHPNGGWGGNIGLGYEFRNSGLWTNVGLQLSRHVSSITLEKYQENFQGKATNGDPATFYYDVEQVDKHQLYSLDIPVMAGYYVKGFYAGGGLKVGYYVSPKTNTTGIYELSAKHEQYTVVFHHMPEWGYGFYQFDQTHKTQLKPQISLIGEIGYDLLSSMPTRSTICHILKLGFYFEIGLNHMAQTSTLAPVVPKSENATSAQINPYLNSRVEKGDRVAPFLTGLRLTYTIGGSRTAHAGRYHHGCQCYD